MHVRETDRTFGVASEDNLVRLINGARQRLVVICPALTERVAEAVAARLDEGFSGATVIVDADPEVYRLGYGTEAALDHLRASAARNLFDLRIQSGVRIGVVISDDTTMVFAPVPLLIEAGSTSAQKPNAIVLSGNAANRLADAAGAGSPDTDQEIGTESLTPEAAKVLKDDLKVNPPQPFDVARALRVFSSKVQYVEIHAGNYRLSSRQIQLPAELRDISDDELRKRISSRLHAPVEVLGPFKIKAETEEGEDDVEADERWITRERKRIEDRYTYVVPRYGRVIFSREREEFDRDIKRFERNLAKYCQAARDAFIKTRADFENRLVNEFQPKWQQNPPARFARFGIRPDKENIERELRAMVKRIVEEAISFEAPRVRVVYKNIAHESIYDPAFRDRLESLMRRRGVPIAVIESLFAVGDAAPATSAVDSLLV